MKKFNSLLEFSEHLIKAATVEIIAYHEGLKVAAELIQEDAKNQIGYLQPSVSSFPAWEELAASTKYEKELLGYGDEDNDWQPLLRTGELRDSIQYEIDMSRFEAIIGSKSPIAAFQEFGTKTIPPRPFIGTAAFICAPQIAKIFGIATMLGIAGGRVMAADIAKEIGYQYGIKL